MTNRVNNINKNNFILKLSIILLSILLSIFSVYANFHISKINIEIWNKIIKWDILFNSIEIVLNKRSNNNIDKKIKLYEKYIELLNKINKKDNVSKVKKEKVIKLLEIFNYGLNKSIKDYNTKVKKVLLWYSELNKEIYWYYRWNPENWFFWIFANLHWSYEYWTYDTAKYLIDELTKSNKMGWFIIPTLNPDGLDAYKKYWKHDTFYLSGRSNKNNVDLNRNFCTTNFLLKTFNKYWNYFKTWIKWCNSEKEVKTILSTLNNYKFNEIISLHSVWKNFFIPDNSFDDKKIRDLWNKMKNILSNYHFNLSYKTGQERKQKIFDYEIDEWWSNKFTWTMETYIYEKYNIPILIIELKQHWKIEYNLLNIKDFLKNN